MDQGIQRSGGVGCGSLEGNPEEGHLWTKELRNKGQWDVLTEQEGGKLGLV